ncbi:phage tail protein [Novosphingobium sp.]|uniref:phage tail protein n=1 Tax=Novosphingobium sp. TaxID=1874826 RepID=UPI001D1BAC70|nr:phage tail protein [Novosphingobium sp.]MBX9664798.1 phage tail protein [Novosphingobium sp.]
MATLLLTAVGTVFGGPIGGSIGAIVGRQIDAAIFGGRKVEGPRLKDLTVQTSSYGSALPLHFGKMRAAGSVIWATELVEHKDTASSGKGRPSVTTYTYTSSFAVAIASRPIAGIGRIWADGNLLRGANGDLKVGGTLRVHLGHGDQAADPLMAQAEGVTRCPAYRGLAYAVFEDLELADYGNRIPSLTFEILADTVGTSIGAIARAILPEAAVSNLDTGLAGFSIDQGSAGDALAVISEAVPIACAVSGGTLAIHAAEQAGPVTPVALPGPAAANKDGRSAEAKASGWSRKREPLPRVRQCGVRYYDVARDYQPGLQRGIGRSEQGDLQVIELPAALSAAEAQTLASNASRRAARPADTITYRITEIDPAITPGAFVNIPIASGVWRVTQWEWQQDGVLLSLAANPSSGAIAGSSATTTDPGRFNPAADLAHTPTVLEAFALPWDGTGSGTTAAVFAAASGASAGWTGAALLADLSGDGGALTSIGSTGRSRARLGRTVGALATASPLLLDLQSTLDVVLAGTDLQLADASLAQLLQGANRARIGSEIVQFASATPLGGGVWRLGNWLRGRGGTEWAVGTHVANEQFVLIDDSLVQLDATQIGDPATTRIVAVGLGDTSAVSVSIEDSAATLRPLSPVHGTAVLQSDGSIALRWTRRARGAWLWLDNVDTPLNEESELWDVTVGDPDAPALRWQATTSAFVATAEQITGLPTGAPQFFSVRQIGRNAASVPLRIEFPA